MGGSRLAQNLEYIASKDLRGCNCPVPCPRWQGCCPSQSAVPTLDFSETRLLLNFTTPYLPSSSTSPACHVHMGGRVRHRMEWLYPKRSGARNLETLHKCIYDFRIAPGTLQAVRDCLGPAVR